MILVSETKLDRSYYSPKDKEDLLQDGGRNSSGESQVYQVVDVNSKPQRTNSELSGQNMNPNNISQQTDTYYRSDDSFDEEDDHVFGAMETLHMTSQHSKSVVDPAEIRSGSL